MLSALALEDEAYASCLAPVRPPGSMAAAFEAAAASVALAVAREENCLMAVTAAGNHVHRLYCTPVHTYTCTHAYTYTCTHSIR
jgi:hypothetical protein